MGFKTLSLNAAVATAVVAGSAMAIAPAQAATLTSGSFTLTPPTLSQSGSNFRLTFGGTVTGAGGLSVLTGTPISQVLTLVPIGGSQYRLSSPVPNFITRTVGANTISVSLLPSTFDLLGTFPSLYAFGTSTLGFDVNYNGVRELAGQAFVSASSLPAFRSASFQAQVIPTPALIPGLLGLGLAAFRKRKTEVAEEVS